MTKPLGYEARAFLKRFQSHLAAEKLLPRWSSLLLAVSGGPDSMALLFLLSRLAPKYHWKLSVVHVNYHLRGEDSLLDEKLVRETAKKLGHVFFVLHSRAKPTKNIESKLRDIRYAFFERIRTKAKADLLVTAHTENDLTETLLMNLLRGAGKQGMAPMRDQTSVTRPFLTTKRRDILSFLASESLPYRHDKSNASLLLTRNRIRHELLPFLERDFNPNIVETLARAAREQHGEKATSLFFPLVTKLEAHTFSFDRREFLHLTREERFAFLAVFFRKLLGQSPSERFLGEVEKAASSRKSKHGFLSRRDLKISFFHDRVETTFMRP